MSKVLSPLSYALWLIKRRLRSKVELEQALERRGVAEEDRMDVMRQLQANGLVDDVRFAQAWISSRDQLSPRGTYVLRQELLQKGVSKEIIDQVLLERSEQSVDEGSVRTEEDMIRDLVDRRSRQYASLPPDVRKRRLMAFLNRRGFSYDVVRRILDT